MLNRVLDRELAALATAGVVDIGASVGQLADRLVRVRVVDRTEVRQVQRCAAVLAMRLVCPRSQTRICKYVTEISYRRGTARRAVSAETLRNVAQMFNRRMTFKVIQGHWKWHESRRNAILPISGV